MALTLDGTNGVTFPSGSGTQAAQSKVLQVVSATYSTSTTTTSSSFVDTGLSVSITPLFSTSKIFIIIQALVEITKSSTTDTGAQFCIVRNSTTIWQQGTIASEYLGISGNGPNLRSTKTYTYLDSPTTTSATTYKLQMASFNTSSVTAQLSSTPSVITLMEIAV